MAALDMWALTAMSTVLAPLGPLGPLNMLARLATPIAPARWVCRHANQASSASYATMAASLVMLATPDMNCTMHAGYGTLTGVTGTRLRTISAVCKMEAVWGFPGVGAERGLYPATMRYAVCLPGT
jgi:hypothetical protein